MNGTEKLKELINRSNNIVFFGGAGVSTESGIPDFRSTDGLYHQEYDYPPETILSHSFFMRNPEEFYRFYKNKMLCLDAKPNMAHKKLAELEKAGKLKAVITQNIDGLHQAAGSKEVLELHGSVHRNYCMKCGKSYDAEYMLHAEGVPTCSCGGRIKPDVVLYEEPLDEHVLTGAVAAIAAADALIVGGTSLVVYPAAGLTRYFTGDTLAICNLAPTDQDANADLLISCDIAAAFAF
jgi:NAD-dependent deacetylase